MKILVIGASGQVGKSVSALAVRKGHEVFETSDVPVGRQIFLDLCDPGSVSGAVKSVKPELTVLCAAMTYVDGCENDPVTAEKVNVEGPALVASGCLAAGSGLIYLSTEYVFDGVNGPYSETDATNPVSVYGRTKLDGERRIFSVMEHALCLRTTVVYSYDPGTRNFIMQLINNALRDTEMKVPKDQYSNPTYAPELADFMLRLAAAGKSGIYNVVGADRLNRYEFAVKACEVFGFKADFLNPVATSELRQPAARPLNAGLLTGKLMEELGAVPSGVETNLKLMAKCRSLEEGLGGV